MMYVSVTCIKCTNQLQ